MTQLFAGPAEWPPALHDHNQLLFLIVSYVANNLKALPIEADIQDEVTVSRHVCWAHHCHFFYVAVGAHVGCYDVSI